MKMPIREYFCEKCNWTEEVFLQGQTYSHQRNCVKCDGDAKLIPSLTAMSDIRFAPRWHHGIGAKVSSTGEVNRIAKEKNLLFVGRHHGG